MVFLAGNMTAMQIILIILAAFGFQPRQRFAVLRDVTPRLLR